MYTSFKELPLGLYEQAQRIAAEGGDDIDVQVRIVALLTGKTIDEVGDLPLPDYAKASAAASFLLTPIDTEGVEVRNSYEVGDFVLVPVMDPRKMTAAQYIDFQTMTASEDKGITLAQTLSCLMVPEGKRYNDGYDGAEVAQAIADHLPSADAFALMAHFFALSGAFIKDTVSSLEKVTRKMKDPKKKAAVLAKLEELRTLADAGDGSPA